MKRPLLTLLASLLIVAGLLAQETLRFFAFGDMGTGESGQHKVARALAKAAQSGGLDFMLTTGDNFYPDGVQSVTDPQWEGKFETVYADAALQVPVYASLGNHDWSGEIQAQIDYSAKSLRWRMPSRYYTFVRALADGTQVQFFALDTESLLNADAEQLAWLQQELAGSSARWKIAFGHRPIYSCGERHGKESLRDQLEPLFVDGGLDLYLCGHHHSLQVLQPQQGVHYIVTGGGAGKDNQHPVLPCEEKLFSEVGGGFVACRVGHDSIQVEVFGVRGPAHYTTELVKPGKDG